MQFKARFTFIFLIFFSIKSYGQTDSLVLKAEKYYKDGMESFSNDHRKKATELFLKAIQLNPKHAEANLMAGKSIMLTINKKHALKYFKNAFALNPKIDEDIIFLIGQAYHYAEEFDSALLYYDMFNRLLYKSLLFERTMKVNEVNRKIFECRNAMVYKANPVKVTIENLGPNINSEYADYAPNISADESLLIFTTRRPDKNNNENLAEDLEFYEEIHLAKKVNGKWQPSANVGGPLNSAFHNSNISLSPNGKEMFVYLDENGGDLYETDLKDDGTWSKPNRMNGYINSPYLENSAAVTKDDKKLFFVSDRPGGYGGTDIYVATKNKRGEWSNVQNLGPVVNTAMDEEDVFVSASGQHIYFSSNGHAGMGDLDIYRSSFDSAKMQWTEPLNLGYPVNSVENDIYFVLSGDERYAYISSVRDDSKGDQDIYRVDLLNWKPITRQELMEKEMQSNRLTPVITYVDSKQTAGSFANPASAVNSTQPSTVRSDQPSATIGGMAPLKKYEPITLTIETNGEDGKPIDGTIILTDDQSKEIPLQKNNAGVYIATIQNQANTQYKVKAEAAGFIPVYSTLHVIGQSENNNLKESLVLRKVDVNTEIILNLYYNSNQATISNPEDLQIIKSLLVENPSIKIKVEGHTDNSGDEQYNLQLSRARAENVKKTLVQSGIDAFRIITNGFGESRPITDNKTYSARKLNRRTTFTIVEK